MADIFARLQNRMFDTVSFIMGVDATWTPIDGSPAETGKVLVREPTHKDRMNGVEYAPFIRFLEYRQGFFPGLVDAVRSGELETIVTDDGREFIVKDICAVYDGKTIKLESELKE